MYGLRFVWIDGAAEFSPLANKQLHHNFLEDKLIESGRVTPPVKGQVRGFYSEDLYNPHLRPHVDVIYRVGETPDERELAYMLYDELHRNEREDIARENVAHKVAEWLEEDDDWLMTEEPIFHVEERVTYKARTGLMAGVSGTVLSMRQDDHGFWDYFVRWDNGEQGYYTEFQLEAGGAPALEKDLLDSIPGDLVLPWDESGLDYYRRSKLAMGLRGDLPESLRIKVVLAGSYESGTVEAYDGEALIGRLKIEPSGMVGHIEVLDEYRRRGIAEAMLWAYEDQTGDDVFHDWGNMSNAGEQWARRVAPEQAAAYDEWVSLYGTQRCPNCGSTHIYDLPGDQAQCGSCGNTFYGLELGPPESNFWRWMGEREGATSEDTEPKKNFGFLQDPHSELYACAFDSMDMRPEARNKIIEHVMNALDKSEVLDNVRPAVYFTVYGSGASYNWDEDGDFDVQMWVDAAKYNENNPEGVMEADDLIAEIRRTIAPINFPSFADLGLSNDACSGRMLVQYYAKPGTGSADENLASKPYACYDMEADEWLQRPEKIDAKFYGEAFILVLPKAEDVALQAEAHLTELDRNVTNWQFWSQLYNKYDDPQYLEIANEAMEKAIKEKDSIKTLFDGVFGGRQKAYSPEGEGIRDERDILQKMLEVWGVFQELKHFARAPLPWEDHEMPDPPKKEAAEVGKFSGELIPYDVFRKKQLERKQRICPYCNVGKLWYDPGVPWPYICENPQCLAAFSEEEIDNLPPEDDPPRPRAPRVAMAERTGGTYMIDWTATHGYTEFPMVQKLDSGTWQREWTSKTAAWADVQEDAEELYYNGMVELLVNNPDYVEGQVQSQTRPGTVYETSFYRNDPSSGAITVPSCNCEWGEHMWGRTRQWKKYEGRPCKHILALYWESLRSPMSGEDEAPGTQMTLPGTEAPSVPQRPTPRAPQPGMPDAMEQLTIPGTLARVAAWRNGEVIRARVPVTGYTDRGEKVVIPRGAKGEVLSSDDETTVAIFPLESGPLQAHLVRVEAPTTSFTDAQGTPFVRKRAEWEEEEGYALVDLDVDFDDIKKMRIPFFLMPNGLFEVGVPGQEHWEMPERRWLMRNGDKKPGSVEGDYQGHVIFHPMFGEHVEWPVDTETAEEQPWITDEMRESVLNAARGVWNARTSAMGLPANYTDDDPYDLFGKMPLYDKLQTNWYEGSPEEQRQAIANAFRSTMISPQLELKWNAVAYQALMDVPAEVDEPEAYERHLRDWKRRFDNPGQMDLLDATWEGFGFEEVLPGEKLNPPFWKNVRSLANLAPFIEELRVAALEDIKRGGKGFIFRDAAMKIPGIGPKIASFAWLILQPTTSELAAIDLWMMRHLGEKGESPNDNKYLVLEDKLREERDRLYPGVPLGQYQWAVWDKLRTPGVHQDHSPFRVQDPTPFKEVEWSGPSAVERAQRKRFAPPPVDDTQNVLFGKLAMPMNPPEGMYFTVDYEDFIRATEPGTWEEFREWRQGASEDFMKFFEDASRGLYAPQVGLDMTFDKPEHQDFYDTYKGFAGHFDTHIETSIPGYRDLQVRKGVALTKAFPGGTILDIGGSEGSWAKSVSQIGGQRTVNLEPNDAMVEHYLRNPVPNAELAPQAFLEGFDQYKKYDPNEQFDVINESMTFQFISPDRPNQVAEVKRLLKPDGIFLTDEKVITANWAENERIKDEWKKRFYTEDQLQEKQQVVNYQDEESAVGMVSNMVTQEEFEAVLQQHFRYVENYWSSGNFQGYVCSDSEDAIWRFLRAYGVS